MRKRLITPTPETIRTRGEGWLDVEHAAVVEVTSEDKDFPVEAAFVSGDTQGWRAAAPGSQTCRLIFDQPQTLRCIYPWLLRKTRPAHARIRLRWSPDGGNSLKRKFQPSRGDARSRGISSRAVQRYCTGIGHQAEYRAGTRSRVAQEASLVLTVLPRSVTIHPCNSLRLASF